MEGLLAVILTGGKSSRMGFDKSIHFRDRLYSILKDKFGEPVFSLNETQSMDQYYKDKNFVIDELLLGPISGIYTVMKKLRKSLFVVACDMPLISKKAIDILLKKREKDATLFVDENFYQPLFSIYEFSLLDKLKYHIDNGNRSLIKFLKGENVSLQEFKNSDIFLNVNTLEEFSKYKKYEE